MRKEVFTGVCDCALELRNYVREKAAEMAAILEKVHGVETGEASNVNLEAEAEIPGAVGTSGRSSVPDLRAGYRKL